MEEKRIIRLSEVQSTNSLLRELAAKGAENGQVLIADSQTGGRGRSGNSFASPAGGLYLSMLHRPQSSLASPGGLTASAAVAVSRAVNEVCGVSPGIKWVNDLVLGGKKLCGILVEAVPVVRGLGFIIGVGVNVNSAQADFPEDLRSIAGSIFTETGQKTDIDVLGNAVIKRLDEALIAPEKCIDYYRQHCVTLGHEVLVAQGAKSFAAFAEGINEDFELIVRRADGVRETVSFGEVSVRGLCGYI